MSSDKRHSKPPPVQAGWEEAGGEFYQETYPAGSSDMDLLDNLQRADINKIATLLPSKQIRNATMRRAHQQTERRQSTVAMHNTTVARDVQLSMLPDLSENLSNEERIWEEMMQIKTMPIPMSHKKELKAQLQNTTKLRLQGLEQFHWRQRKAVHRLNRRTNEIISKLTLWKSSFKNIEGNFGTGVVTYFLFIKWLLMLNLAISVIIVIFLVLPVTLIEHDLAGCGEDNSTVCCSELYFNSNNSDGRVIEHLLQGTGFMERTLFYYGFYPSDVLIFNIRDVNLYYDIPLAYILIPCVCFLLSLVAILKSAARGFRDKLIEQEGQLYKYCDLIFCGWDFCIQNEKSAKIKNKALFHELKAFLDIERFKCEKLKHSKRKKISLFFKRLLVNLMVVFILSASLLLIYVSFNYSMRYLGLIPEDSNLIDQIINTASVVPVNNTTRNDIFDMNRAQNLLLEFLPSICIVILNLIVPEIFNYLVKYEKYNSSVIVKVTLLRTVFLRLSSLAVLISQLYLRIIDKNRDVCTSELNVVNQCWETYVGQQLYKLILTNFAVQIVMTFFVSLPRSLIGRYSRNSCMKCFGTLEFNLPKHTLDIVYTQTIIWMGIFYSPLMAIVGTILIFAVFYVKKFNCLVICTPTAKVYNPSKSKYLFMYVLLLSYVIAILPVVYSIAEITPSVSCGPYRGLTTVWEQVVVKFSMFPGYVQSFIFGLATSYFVVPAFACLILILYYYLSVANANRQMVRVLKSQLVLEGHDKQFLLNRLSTFIRQHQNTEVKKD